MITLKTLPQATAQEVYNQAKEHLLKQNERSYLENVGCAYRGERGLICGAGCFISDEEYSDTFENKTWIQLVEGGIAPVAHESLILTLQECHDCFLPDEWVTRLYHIALKFNLIANDL